MREGASSAVEMVGEPAAEAEVGVRGLAWVLTAPMTSWMAWVWVAGWAETLA